MSKFVKTAIAATMVMGAFASTSTIAAGNNGTARFYGTIEDSPCSIVLMITNWKLIWVTLVQGS